MLPRDHLPTCPGCAANLADLVRKGAELPGFCPKCRFPLMLVAGKYRLSGILGKGGFGVVYRALHTGLHRNAERVVKVIKPEV